MSLKQITMSYLLAVLWIGAAPSAFPEDSQDTWDKVVFHVDEKANARWALMLARSYLDDVPDARIVFVTYGPGIDFLTEDAKDARGNPYDHAVQNLVERGVEFRACAATLTARNLAKDQLLDSVSVVPSGISEIARLQVKEGFAYLKP